MTVAINDSLDNSIGWIQKAGAQVKSDGWLRSSAEWIEAVSPPRVFGQWQLIDRIDSAANTQAWGWLPALSLVGACGLLIISIANTAARNSQQWAEPLFWIGLLVIYAPIAARLVSPAITRRESVGLVIVLGLTLYLVKVLHSPLAFTQHDEFYHWRTANDILRSGRLFQENSLLPISAVYPGLENVTSALASLSGLPIYSIGVILIGVARLLLLLGLYLLYEEVSGSARVAAIASLLYMTNPNYLFFLALFKYQSLALPFTVLILFALVRRERRSAATSFGLTLTIFLALGLVVTTHHITAYALTAFLLLWQVVGYPKRRDGHYWYRGALTLVALIANGVWLLYVASMTIDYLAPHLQGTVSELLRMIAGEPDAGRELFGSSSVAGTATKVTPLWERLMAFATIGFILLGLPFGLTEIWQRYRHKAIALTFAVSAIAYPASLALRLTKRGWEIGNRSSEFLFVVVAFVLALGIVKLWRYGRWQRIQILLFAACVSTIFLGGLVAGWKPAWRLPGPYLVESGTRSIELQGIEAAQWVRYYLGPDNRVGADKINMLLMGSYGEQQISTTLSGGVNVNWILYAPQMGSNQDRSLRRGQLQYLVVDRRLFPQQVDKYYPGAPDDAALGKFDQVNGVSRLFDSGDIAIYDVRELSGAR